jgi:2-polyprenyl-3-methyl-5-hydroxy-6-metoxy-1,4-benzoquinol methylase
MAPEESSLGIYEYLSTWFPKAGSLLDLGCGAGGFLDFAKTRGLTVMGVDADHGNAERCRARGLSVVEGDVFSTLSSADSRYDVVSLIHVVEHFTPEDASRLVTGATHVLADGGSLLIVTPNFADPTVNGHIFWLDPTHLRPYPLPLLADFCVASGLEVTSASTEVLVNLGRRRALVRPLQRLRHGREFERSNAVLVARRPKNR